MGSSEELSKDLIFDILRNPRRRYVLYYLKQESEPIELTALAEHVAAWENQTDTESLGNQERKRVYVSLYQTHVPKLADAGLVDYDEDAGTVALTSEASVMNEYLSEPENGPRWHLVYLAEVGVGTLLLLVTVFDPGPFAPLPDALVSAVVLVLFAGTALAHVIYRYRRDRIPVELRPR